MCVIINCNVFILQNPYCNIRSEVKPQKPFYTLTRSQLQSKRFTKMKFVAKLF